MVTASKILSRDEISLVLADCHRRARRSLNSRQNLIVFRLATCCGLRVSEICGLRLRDVHVGIAKPHFTLPRSITKRRKARTVPLWWDGGTLADVGAWKEERIRQGAVASDPFVTTLTAGKSGNPLDRFNARRRFLAACRALGPERTSLLTIHDGRHSAISHWLAAGRTLAEVREAAGHSSISTTSVYTHICVDDDGRPGNIFAEPSPTAQG